MFILTNQERFLMEATETWRWIIIIGIWPKPLLKSVFTLNEPANSCSSRNNTIGISTEPKRSNDKDCDYEVKGYFPERNCSLVDSTSNVVAQIGIKKERTNGFEAGSVSASTK